MRSVLESVPPPPVLLLARWAKWFFLLAIFFSSCQDVPLDYRPLQRQGFQQAITKEEKKLLGESEVYVAYDKEVISWSEYDASTADASGNIAEVEAVPRVERMSYVFRFDKNGNAEMLVTKKIPSRSDIPHLYDLDEERVIAYNYADGTMEMLDKNGQVVSSQEMGLPSFGGIISALGDPCSTETAVLFSAHLITMSGDATALLLPCMREQLEKEGSTLRYTDEGIMLVRRNTLIDFVGKGQGVPLSFNRHHYNRRDLNKGFLHSEGIPIIWAAHRSEVEEVASQPPNTSTYADELSEAGKAFLDSMRAFREQFRAIEESERADISDFSTLTAVDTISKKLISTAYYKKDKLIGVRYLQYVSQESKMIKRNFDIFYSYNYVTRSNMARFVDSEFSNVVTLMNKQD